jgi:hypothetical protein
MNEVPQTQDWLDARLREEAPYIDDAGFTGRVMKQLPRRRSLRTQRAIIILTATILSVVIAYFASGEGWFVREALVRAATLPPLVVFAFVLGCGLLLIVGGLWAALTRIRDPIA